MDIFNSLVQLSNSKNQAGPKETFERKGEIKKTLNGIGKALSSKEPFTFNINGTFKTEIVANDNGEEIVKVSFKSEDGDWVISDIINALLELSGQNVIFPICPEPCSSYFATNNSNKMYCCDTCARFARNKRSRETKKAKAKKEATIDE